MERNTNMRSQVWSGCMKSSETSWNCLSFFEYVFVSLPGMYPGRQLFWEPPTWLQKKRGHVDEAKKVGTGSREKTPWRRGAQVLSWRWHSGLIDNRGMQEPWILSCYFFWNLITTWETVLYFFKIAEVWCLARVSLRKKTWTSKSVTVKLPTFDIHGWPQEIFNSHPIQWELPEKTILSKLLHLGLM